MNTRQQKYKKNRLMGMTPINAARAAGYSENYAKQACRIERLVKVSLEDEFERAGLTDKAIVAYGLKGLEANKLQSCNLYVAKAKAESVEGDKLILNKNSNDFIEVEDWTARHKFFETILKLTGKLKEKVEHKVEHNHFFKEIIAKPKLAEKNRMENYANQN